MKRDQNYQQKQSQQNTQQNQNNNNQQTNNNQSQNTQNNTGNNNNAQNDNQQQSGQSFVDDKLLKALSDFSLKTYGEAILNNNNSNNNNNNQQNNDNQNQEVMTHEQKLVQTIMVTYSQILNDTIGNLTKIYTDFLNISKKCLVDYYAVTEG